MANATDTLKDISSRLETLAATVIAQWGGDQSYMEAFGWPIPGLTRHDLADYLRAAKARVDCALAVNFSDEDVRRLGLFPTRLQFIQTSSVPNLASSNGGNALNGIRGVLDGLDIILDRYLVPPFDLQEVQDRGLLPPAMIAELSKLSGQITRLRTKYADLDERAGAIINAHQAAQSIGDDLQALDDARATTEEAGRVLNGQIEAAKAALAELESRRAAMAQAEREAEIILAKARTAYGAATTQGLGEAFARRADNLNFVTLMLGLMLVAVLGLAGWITYTRVEFVHQLMLQPKPNFQILWLNVTFSALSVSAPVWLAWLITRQIGQRFRLAEDYAYKASVAKAYEGYRREAADIDPDLTKRLFGLALDMVSEAPLRLVEKESPGSPAHELKDAFADFLHQMKPKVGLDA